MKYVRDPNEDPAYTGQHWFVGMDHHEGLVVYVGKPKRQMMVADDGFYFRKLVTLGFRCRDGIVRRGRFCQSDKDTFAPGDFDNADRAPLSDPSAWPTLPAPPTAGEKE